MTLVPARQPTRSFACVYVLTTTLYFACALAKSSRICSTGIIRSSTLSKERDETLIHGIKFICSTGAIINEQNIRLDTA